MGHSISEIVRELGFSRSTVSRIYKEYMDGGQKTSNRANCKEQLALTVRGERRLRYIVRSQRSQTSAQTTTQLNDGASSSAVRLVWAREHRDWSVEDWRRVAWNDESRFRLLNTDGRLRIGCQAHEATDPACQVGNIRGHFEK
ncbi:HTH_Tnp_Tc3_2 domain-containing protein [Trichonephila clavipes]|nr:HTH_Tnp_Tc3_2 domain-containing protein [Trichonephila clavipes]